MEAVLRSMMKRMITIVTIMAFVVIGSQAQSGASSMWKTLADISYVKKYDDFLGFKVDFPVFSKKVRALEGKEVTITGYIIPIEGFKGHQDFIFSAYPYNMCFFCGGAGPESVMEINASEPIQYSAEPITLSGKLWLNDDDVNRLMYGLSDAILVD